MSIRDITEITLRDLGMEIRVIFQLLQIFSTINFGREPRTISVESPSWSGVFAAPIFSIL